MSVVHRHPHLPGHPACLAADAAALGIHTRHHRWRHAAHRAPAFLGAAAGSHVSSLGHQLTPTCHLQTAAGCCPALQRQFAFCSLSFLRTCCRRFLLLLDPHLMNSENAAYALSTDAVLQQVMMLHRFPAMHA